MKEEIIARRKKFEDLPDDEKQKDVILAKFILSLYKVS